MFGSRNVLLVLGLSVTVVVQAQFPFFGGGRREPMPEVVGSVRLDPAEVVVGIPCHFVFTFKGTSAITPQRIAGLPDGGIEYLADELEPYADNTFRLPVRVLEPNTNELAIAVSGMQTVERGAGTAFRSSFSQNFVARLSPFRLNVRPLPSERRPQAFEGAVGTKFLMTQKLVPDRVHPGDLVTATYELKFEGYCPSNTWPRIEHLSKAFKAYAPKEVSRGPNTFTWTQILVPRTTEATNSALVSLCYYNPHTRRYEFARSYPKKLVFVSDKAASTENTSVVIARSAESEKVSGGAIEPGTTPITVHFAPSESSPVIATLPPGTPVKELSRSNGGWRRIESPRAIGWTR